MTTAETTACVELDIRGQICPSALLTALRQINARKEQIRGGTQKLVIRTDNRTATRTIPEAAANMGYEVEVAAEPGHYRITVQSRDQIP